LFETIKLPITADKTGKLAIEAAVWMKAKSPETSARWGKARLDWEEYATEKSPELEALDEVRTVDPLCMM
jgi:hypothetical protein